jgi:Carboxypeptidase regulatory-like domain
MLRDNLAGLIEPMPNSARQATVRLGAMAVALVCPTTASAQRGLPASVIFKNVKPSIVLIIGGDRKTPTVQGSGFNIVPNRVATNRHVMAGTSVAGCLYYYGNQSQQALPHCAWQVSVSPNDHTAYSNYGWAALDANQVNPFDQTGEVVGRQSNQEMPGIVSGTIVDQTAAVVAGAHVSLTQGKPTPHQDAITDNDGNFSIPDVAPGPFLLTITAPGLATQSVSGMLWAGQIYDIPQISMAVAPNVMRVKVTLPREEIAEEQVKAEEKQRVLGAIPNFYVTYVPNAAPLNSKQKFQLAWRSLIDPFTFGVTAAVAGIQQADDQFSGYGQGAEGYAKRYGAALPGVGGTFIGGAILPTIFKQDPRFFYKGTGTVRSRIWYAIATAVICKGDSGRWEPNYSNVLGSLAAGAISNLYYPKSNRNGIGLTLTNTLVGLGDGAATNLVQEFVVPRFSHIPKQNASKPNP